MLKLAPLSTSTRAVGGFLLIVVPALTSCGGGGGSTAQPVVVPPSGGGGTVEPPPKGLLIALESPEQFKQTIAAGFDPSSSDRALLAGDGTVS